MSEEKSHLEQADYAARVSGNIELATYYVLTDIAHTFRRLLDIVEEERNKVYS